MKKIFYLHKIALSAALLTIIPTHTMSRKRGDDLISSIGATIDNLKKQRASLPSDINEINSPAIQKEQAKITKKALRAIMQDAKELDNFINALSPNERATWKSKQSTLLDPAKNILTPAITQVIKTTWQEHGKAIAQTALTVVLAGVTTAACGLVTQGIQMGTGNLLALDTNTLLVTGLTSAAAAALTALGNTNNFLQSTSTSAISESLIAPSVTNKQYTLTIPSASGPILSWITSEAMAIVTKTVENRGGITVDLNNVAKTLLPGRGTNAPSNQLVAAALPTVQNIIGNKKIASVLTETGWIIMQSAAVGATMYMAGFGYADSTITESVGYAVLTGVAQGTLASVMTFGKIVSPGAILSITSAPLAQQALVIAGGTRQAAVTAVIQATVTEVTNVLLNVSKQDGGLLESLKKGKALLGQTALSRWNSIWSSVADVWETIQSIEPVPL